MAEKVILELEAKTGEAQKNIDDTTKSMKELNKEIDKTKDNEGVGGLGKESKEGSKGIAKLSKGFKGLGVAMKAARYRIGSCCTCFISRSI